MLFRTARILRAHEHERADLEVRAPKTYRRAEPSGAGGPSGTPISSASGTPAS
jgi:hypothetical protein